MCRGEKKSRKGEQQVQSLRRKDVAMTSAWLMKKRSLGVAAAIAVTLSHMGTPGGNLKGKV